MPDSPALEPAFATIAVPARRWDPLVKLTHWSIALAVLANAAVTEEGSDAHVWVGYGLAVILGLRLLWGLVGPVNARFTAFPPSPGRAIAHVREILVGRVRPHASHNPLGALMVYAIWACLLVIIGTGIGMSGLPGGQPPARETAAAPMLQLASFNEAEGEGGEGGERGEREAGALGEVHEVAAKLLYALILAHLAGVLFESRRSRTSLVRSMLPGGR